MDAVTDLKQKGNTHFAKRQYQEAIDLYSSALDQCSVSKQKRETATINIQSLLYSNRAQCHIELKHYQQGITDCNASIALIEDHQNTNRDKLWKSYYRRGLCRESLSQNKEALSDLSNALRLCPQSDVPTTSKRKSHRNSKRKRSKSNKSKSKSITTDNAATNAIQSAIDRINAMQGMQFKESNDDEKVVESELKSKCFLNDTTFGSQHAESLIMNGYVVIDEFFESEIASKLLSEMKSMMKLENPSYLKPNTTLFKNEQNKICSFNKPGIWEIDLHSIFGSQSDSDCISYPLRFPNFYQLFSSNVLSEKIESTLNGVSIQNGSNGTEWNLKKGDGEYAIKVCYDILNLKHSPISRTFCLKNFNILKLWM